MAPPHLCSTRFSFSYSPCGKRKAALLPLYLNLMERLKGLLLHPVIVKLLLNHLRHILRRILIKIRLCIVAQHIRPKDERCDQQANFKKGEAFLRSGKSNDLRTCCMYAFLLSTSSMRIAFSRFLLLYERLSRFIHMGALTCLLALFLSRPLPYRCESSCVMSSQEMPHSAIKTIR